MKERIVISLGGSIIIPQEINITGLKALQKIIEQTTSTYQFYIIPGGGKTARLYQKAAQTLGTTNTNELDKIGIKACNLNAQFIKTLWKNSAYTEQRETLNGHKEDIVISGIDGPTGNSSDLMAVQVAETIGAKKVINLSNITHAHTHDPKIHEKAEKIHATTWEAFIPLVNKPWQPGLNTPFDYKASILAQKNKITVIIADGNHTENLRAILTNQPYQGTTITP